jgi:uncharacterized protein
MMYYARNTLKGLVSFGLKSLMVFGLVIATFLISISFFVNRVTKETPTNNFTVSGTAKRYVAPDTAEITIGTIVEGINVNTVQTDATKKINAAVDAVKALGIEEKDIQTSGFNLTPKRNSDSDITGYSIDITIKVTVRNVQPKDEKVGKVVSAGTDSGLNEVRSLNFSIEDQEKILDELKLEAIDDAKSRANELADKSGLRLGELKNVSDSSYYPYYYGSANYEMAADSVKSTAPATAPVQVQPGQYELSSSVTLTYEIR